MRILVSGFCAFGEHAANPTEALLGLLPARMGDCEIDTLLLPVEFERSGRELVGAIDALRPDAVLALGLAASREAISVERIAVNLMDARIPDNAGAQPVDAPIVPGGPAAYFATIPPRRVVQAIQAGGTAAALSASAGLYVCNAVYYAALHHASQNNHAFHTLFIHVPMWDASELIEPIKSAICDIIAFLDKNE